MYNVVIIGAGNIAARFDLPNSKEILTHAHAFTQNSSFNLIGFYDKNYVRAYEAAEIWGGQAFNKLELGLQIADVVVCCVPDIYHAIMLKEIAQYHPRLVVTEKPLALTLKETEKIKGLYENRIPLLVNYSRRFIADFQELKKKISEYGSFLRGVGYYGKGILHNGSHMIDLLNFLFEKVELFTMLPFQNNDFDSEDCSKEVILSIDGNPFHMIAIDCRIATIFELDLFFEKARIRILDGGNQIEIYSIKDSDTYSGYRNYHLSNVIEVNYSMAMEGLVRNVENYLEHNEKLLCDLSDGIKALEICMNMRGE